MAAIIGAKLSPITTAAVLIRYILPHAPTMAYLSIFPSTMQREMVTKTKATSSSPWHQLFYSLIKSITSAVYVLIAIQNTPSTLSTTIMVS